MEASETPLNQGTSTTTQSGNEISSDKDIVDSESSNSTEKTHEKVTVEDISTNTVSSPIGLTKEEKAAARRQKRRQKVLQNGVDRLKLLQGTASSSTDATPTATKEEKVTSNELTIPSSNDSTSSIEPKSSKSDNLDSNTLQQQTCAKEGNSDTSEQSTLRRRKPTPLHTTETTTAAEMDIHKLYSNTNNKSNYTDPQHIYVHTPKAYVCTIVGFIVGCLLVYTHTDTQSNIQTNNVCFMWVLLELCMRVLVKHTNTQQQQQQSASLIQTLLSPSTLWLRCMCVLERFAFFVCAIIIGGAVFSTIY